MIKISLPNSIIGEMFTHDHESDATLVLNHEMFVVEFLMKNLKSDSNFIDIGAYQGNFTLVASKKIKTGMIYSFEPCISSYEILRINVELHKLTNVKTFNMVVCDKTGSTTIYWRPGAQCISRIFDIPTDNNEYFPNDVLSTSLDDVHNLFKYKMATIDCIKVDIEGAEIELFRGAKKFFDRNKQCKVILELHSSNIRQRTDANLDKFLDFLQDTFDFYNFDMKKWDKHMIDNLYMPSIGGANIVLVPK